MPNVGVDQADTYKCFAQNEFGRAVVTVTLNIIEGKHMFCFCVDDLLQMHPEEINHFRFRVS